MSEVRELYTTGNSYLDQSLQKIGNRLDVLEGLNGEITLLNNLKVNGTVKSNGYFAEIHLHSGSTAQSILTGSTYTKLTGFTDNGQSSNCTPDVANDKITITKEGKYFVAVSISGYSGTANVVFKFAVFLNGVEQDNVHSNRKYSTANDVGSCSLTGFIDVTKANLDLDLRAAHDNVGNINFTPAYMNLSVFYLGET